MIYLSKKYLKIIKKENGYEENEKDLRICTGRNDDGICSCLRF